MELVETTYSDSVKVDRDAGIIHGVKVLGRTSKNGREYSPQALQDAARIYEGIKVRFDHPPKNDPNRERQFIDSFGRLENLRLTDDGVFADLPFKKAHPYAPLVCESAERFAKEFGLSHNAEGTVTQKGGKLIVESITKARGVDVVDSPASTQGLFESGNEPEPSVTISLTEYAAMPPGAGAVAKPLAKPAPTKALPAGEEDVGLLAQEAPTISPNEQRMKDAMEEMILSIFRDETIDSATTARKIAKGLQYYDKLIDVGAPGNGQAEETPPEEATSEEAPTNAEPEKEEATSKKSPPWMKESENNMAEVTPKPTPNPNPTPEPTPTPPTTDGDGNITEAQFRGFMESVVAENNQLKAENAKLLKEKVAMEREVKARRLLESKGREANPLTEDGRRNVETLLRVESESIWPTLIDSWPAKHDRKRPVRTGSVLESQSTGRRYHSPLDVHDGKSLVAAIFE